MQPETNFKNRIRPYLKSLPNTWMVKTQQLSQCGIPDFLMCVGGQFVAMELKKDAKSKPTKLQIHTLGKIEDAGGISLVVYPENWKEIYGMLINLSQGDTSAAQLQTAPRSELHVSNAKTRNPPKQKSDPRNEGRKVDQSSGR